MRVKCPLCHAFYQNRPKSKPRIRKSGKYFRKCDRKNIQRYFCLNCHKGFSQAFYDPFYRHRKRSLHSTIAALLTSTVSQRAASRILNINRKTLVRKFLILGVLAGVQIQRLNEHEPCVNELQFDDMETFEHTKCKPLSITLAVQNKTRRVLGFEVSSMPAKGRLASISLKKYGPREDHRPFAREKLFQTLKPLMAGKCLIQSDQNPHYLEPVQRHFPESKHLTYKGRRGCVVGQGELKRGGYDPLYSLNHTCAKLRADTNRLLRRTWCTTKKPERLKLHLNLVILNHNLGILNSA